MHTTYARSPETKRQFSRDFRRVARNQAVVVDDQRKFAGNQGEVGADRSKVAGNQAIVVSYQAEVAHGQPKLPERAAILARRASLPRPHLSHLGSQKDELTVDLSASHGESRIGAGMHIEGNET